MDQSNKAALQGRVRILFQGVYEEGKRLTMKEWANALYGSTAKVQQVYYLRRRLTRLGFPVVTMPPDPDKPIEAGVLVPLTESRDVARHANIRSKAAVSTALHTISSYFIEELNAFPDMQAEITEHVTDMHEMQASVLKIAGAAPKPLISNE